MLMCSVQTWDGETCMNLCWCFVVFSPALIMHALPCVVQDALHRQNALHRFQTYKVLCVCTCSVWWYFFSKASFTLTLAVIWLFSRVCTLVLFQHAWCCKIFFTRVTSMRFFISVQIHVCFKTILWTKPLCTNITLKLLFTSVSTHVLCKTVWSWKRPWTYFTLMRSWVWVHVICKAGSCSKALFDISHTDMVSLPSAKACVLQEFPEM